MYALHWCYKNFCQYYLFGDDILDLWELLFKLEVGLKENNKLENSCLVQKATPCYLHLNCSFDWRIIIIFGIWPSLQCYLPKSEWWNISVSFKWLENSWWKLSYKTLQRVHLNTHMPEMNYPVFSPSSHFMQLLIVVQNAAIVNYD